jgi:hypothetical protein
MSRMRTIVPPASANAIESGMSVFFIQKPPLASSSKRKIIPASAGRDSRFMSPTWRSSSSSATSTANPTSPPSVSMRTRGPSVSTVVVAGASSATEVVPRVCGSSPPPQAAASSRRTRTARARTPPSSQTNGRAPEGPSVTSGDPSQAAAGRLM